VEENILLRGQKYVSHSVKAITRLRTTTVFNPGSVLVLSVLGSLHAWGASGVVAAIERKYVITEVSANRDQVTKDGTTMSLRTAGIYSLPTNGIVSTPPDNVVLEGRIKSPNMMVKYTLEKFGAHVLQSGEKVYITRIEDKSDQKADALKFTLLTVNALAVAGQDAQKNYSATVTFKFNKGYLNETPPQDVEQMIEAVMAPDSGPDEQQQAAGGAGAPPQPPAQALAPRPSGMAPPPPQPVASPAPAGPPPTISIGESSTQVLQAMGMPMQMIDLGKKKTYVYKNMKVIFVDDKVSDVQ
jgi:hypothetical protein